MDLWSCRNIKWFISCSSNVCHFAVSGIWLLSVCWKTDSGYGLRLWWLGQDQGDHGPKFKWSEMSGNTKKILRQRSSEFKVIWFRSIIDSPIFYWKFYVYSVMILEMRKRDCVSPQRDNHNTCSATVYVSQSRWNFGLSSKNLKCHSKSHMLHQLP